MSRDCMCYRSSRITPKRQNPALSILLCTTLQWRKQLQGWHNGVYVCFIGIAGNWIMPMHFQLFVIAKLQRSSHLGLVACVPGSACLPSHPKSVTCQRLPMRQCTPLPDQMQVLGYGERPSASLALEPANRCSSTLADSKCF